MSLDRDPYARVGVRVTAGFMDLVLLACAAAVLTWLGLEFQAAAPENRSELFQAIVQLWQNALFFPVALLVVALMALCWARVRATPGQLLLGCRVLRRRGAGSLNILLALWRAVAIFALAGPAAVPLLSMFFDPRRRAVHDWLSDSVVVIEDESRVPLDEWLSMLE